MNQRYAIMTASRFLNIRIVYWTYKLIKQNKLVHTDLQKLRFNKLKKLIDFTYNNYKYYRQFWNDQGFDPSKFRSMDDLENIPVIDKEFYREFTRCMISSNKHKYSKYFTDSSSGSIGKPLKVYRTWDERAYMVAKFIRSLVMNGLKLSDRPFNLPAPYRMVKRDSIIQKFGILKRATLPYTSLPENVVNNLIKSRSNILYGNRSHLMLIAEYVIRNKVILPKLKLIVSAGETLDDISRRTMEEAFGDNLVEIYGTVETNNLAYQQKGEDFLRINHDTNILEIGTDDTESNIGSAIITDLNIFSFPIIRYRLGDLLELDIITDEQVIRDIIGREDDMFITSEGRKIPSHDISFAEEAFQIGIKHYRFIQHSLDELTVQLAVEEDSDMKLIESRVTSLFRDLLNPKLKLNIHIMDFLKPDPTGKIRKVTSEVN